MRTKFKMRLIETERDFSVYEILTKKGELTGYNAEATKYYDGSVNYWKIRNTRTNMWKRCESEKELFSTLEKIKTDSAYARKFGEILSEAHAEKNQKIKKGSQKKAADIRKAEDKKEEQKNAVDTITAEDKKKVLKIGFAIVIILCVVGLFIAADHGYLDTAGRVVLVIIAIVVGYYAVPFGIMLLCLWPFWEVFKIMAGL